tara:strand:- start:10 stop:465 length:456 start_codon:yes stop_codon:yes gene_type:complete
MSVDMFQYSPKLRCYTDGRVERFTRGKYWRVVENKDTSNGYSRITLDGSTVRINRFIAFCFLGLPTLKFDGNIEVDHIDRNRLNNSVDNLRLVNHQQNNFNRNAKGYTFNKQRQKYHAQIMVNGTQIFLGLFNTAEEAHEAYLTAKAKYHV